MLEEEIILDEKPQKLLEILNKDGLIDEIDKKGYKIVYLGENGAYLESVSKNFPINNEILKEVQSHLKNTEDTRNYTLFIKYKDIYIGDLSIFNFQFKEGFGLYKYLNNEEKAFYLGQWEKNQKSGLGFLKIDNNHFYFGYFKKNKIDGQGFYYNKENGNYYFGIFNQNVFKKGIYFNVKKDIYYIGEFQNNKKNDNFCYYFNYKKNTLFLGKIKNDLFIKGHLFFLRIKENENDFTIENIRIVYYDKNSKEDSKKIIFKNSNEIYEDVFKSIVQFTHKIKNMTENMKLFGELEECYKDNSYNNALGRYNSYKNSYSFQNDLIDNYNDYSLNFNANLRELDKIKKKNNFKKI